MVFIDLFGRAQPEKGWSGSPLQSFLFVPHEKGFPLPSLTQKKLSMQYFHK